LDWLNLFINKPEETVDKGQPDLERWPDDMVAMQRQVIERLQEQLDALLPQKESQPKKGK
jgi:hypothetical protein